MSPDFGIVETRSKRQKTLLLAPAAFIAVVHNPDKDEIDNPTADETWRIWIISLFYIIVYKTRNRQRKQSK